MVSSKQEAIMKNDGSLRIKRQKLGFGLDRRLKLWLLLLII